jgi:diadenosine tetraphosphate (Ap4A) HIT family hydrolase
MKKKEICGFIDKVVMQLRELYMPDGFNIGFKIGSAADQPFFHTHFCVILRYINNYDVPDGAFGIVFRAKRNSRSLMRTLFKGVIDSIPLIYLSLIFTFNRLPICIKQSMKQ